MNVLTSAVINVGVNCPWHVSKKIILEHATFANPHFGADKLRKHIENYVKYRPVKDQLDWANKGRSTAKFQPYSVRYIRQLVEESAAAKEQLKAVREAARQGKTPKQRILAYDYTIDDEKQLVSDYIEYMSTRAEGDKLYIGRVRGAFTPIRQAKIITALHGNKCAMCGADGKVKDLQIHHIEPLIKDEMGNRDIENQVPVCRECHCHLHGK